jgi:hypothetical protein
MEDGRRWNATFFVLQQVLECKLAVENYCLNVPNLLMLTEEYAVDLHCVSIFIVTVGGEGNI